MKNLIYFLLFAIAKGCEENEWQNSVKEYEKCVKNTQSQIDIFFEATTFNPKICRLMEKMLECSEVLSPNCMESHLDQATSLIFNMPVNLEKWSSVMQNCQAQSEPRYKRSAGKSKGNRGSSISRAISRISTARNLSKGRLPSSSSSHGKSGILSSLASNRGKSGLLGGLLASRASKGSGSLGKKKGLLGKVGKYAVAGLAAYGTYKLAKSMAKGLRREYDDDDCWEYSILRDRYECVCAAQCNVYVGSAVSISISMGLLALTTTLTVFFNRN